MSIRHNAATKRHVQKPALRAPGRHNPRVRPVAMRSVLLALEGHPIIGHRGASGLAPENTLASFDLAARQGAEAFELDVRLAADGVPVVCHDPTLDRTVGRPDAIRDLSSAELAIVDAGARFSPDLGRTFPFRGQGLGVPTLRSVLERHPGMPVLIELKEQEAAGPVGRLLEELEAAGRCVVASFVPGAILPFKRSPFAAGASRREILALTLQAWFGGARPAGVSLYAVPVRYKDVIPVPTRRFVAAARRLGCPVHVWTVNEVAVAHRLWDAGCAGMITNYPGRLRAARDERFT